MKKLRVLTCFGGLGLALSFGCSAGGGTGSRNLEPSGGSSGTGTGGSSGSVGATGGGGTSGSSAAGGSGGTIVIMGGSSGASAAGGAAPVCNSLTAKSTILVPTVEVLVDTSSSMFETMPTAWSVLYDALDGTDGALKGFQDQINFGFASYKGAKASSETDPKCATMTTVAPGPMNFNAIDTVYKQVGMTYDPTSPPSPKWETPTNYAIGYAVSVLQAYNPMPPGPKYILLVTDGNPNTCQTIDPQCGQDQAIKAAQDAYAAGIGLFVLGVGDIVSNPNSGCPTSARCGLLHLQDLANAGVGAPVTAPPGCVDPTDPGCKLKYEACNNSMTLTASYAATADNVGTPFTVDTSAGDAQQKLKDALGKLLNQAVSCTFDLDAIVTGNAANSSITLDGTELKLGDPNGWALEDNKYQVTLQGSACDTYRSGADHNVSVTFFCDEMGNPVAEPR